MKKDFTVQGKLDNFKKLRQDADIPEAIKLNERVEFRNEKFEAKKNIKKQNVPIQKIEQKEPPVPGPSKRKSETRAEEPKAIVVEPKKPKIVKSEEFEVLDEQVFIDSLDGIVSSSIKSPDPYDPETQNIWILPDQSETVEIPRFDDICNEELGTPVDPRGWPRSENDRVIQWDFYDSKTTKSLDGCTIKLSQYTYVCISYLCYLLKFIILNKFFFFRVSKFFAKKYFL